MTRLRIAHAGCDEGMVRKLNLVANLLRGRGFKPVLSRWEGAGVDLAIIDCQDGFGRRVAEVARRRKIPLLVVGDREDLPSTPLNGERSIHRERPVIEYFRLVEALSGAEPGTTGITPETLDLARGKRLVAGSADVMFEADTGLCRAGSHRELATVAHHLSHCRPVEVLAPPPGFNARKLEVCTSIENLVFNSLVARNRVVWPHADAVNLTGWPDIHNKRHGSDVASLSAILLGKPVGLESLGAVSSEVVVASFLHACRVAGLLVQNSGKAPPAPLQMEYGPQEKNGVVGALRRWLGI
ncbi:hypothetical protein EZI54_11400 [Marinobacter halodurans]|uniref:Uncharacterized protein n=1 Tax=Marinobacter halodurans TaxID=2528979 RepID=A0ABY1ZJN7_9GAMM|nr:hypothetical protein [Marinobacter halodurans]TBW55427.1 hypothetical protein EZI54_11400 [Marinobacter halodurans]